MATIEEVARFAGVSTGTVSRVLNGNYKTKTARHDKVLWAAKELGYSLPQTLVLDASDIKVLVISSTSTKSYTDVIEALGEVSPKYNASVVYKLIKNSNVGEEILPAKGEYDGVILCDIDLDENLFRRLQSICPVVLCRKQYDFGGCVSVSIDDEKAGYDITSKLIEMGHKRIFFYRNMYGGQEYKTVNDQFFLPDERTHRRKRYIGYLRACLEYNIDIPEEYNFIQNIPSIPVENMSAQFINTEMADLLKSSQRPDAIIVQDYNALHLISLEIERSGISMPDELVLASFISPPSPLSGVTAHIGQPFIKIVDMTLRTLRLIIRGELGRDEGLSIYVDHTVEVTLF